MSDDPGRWVDGGDGDAADEALQLDLARASDHDVGYDVAAGLARFEASIAAAPVGEAGGASGSSGSAGGAASAGTAASGGAGKAVLTIVGIVAIAGLGAIAVGGGDDEARPEPAPVVAQDDAQPRTSAPPRADAGELPLVPADPHAEPTEPQTPSTPEPPTVPSAPVDPPSETEDTGSPGPKASSRTAPRAKPTSKSASPSKADAPHDEADDAVAREMAATDAARRALSKDPARALELARKADAAFPGGLFAQQRRGIAVLAELALGRGEAAAQRYLDAHPKGTYAAKIRAALDAKKP